MLKKVKSICWDNEKWLVEAVAITSIIVFFLSMAFFYFSNRRDEATISLIGGNLVATKYEASSQDLVLAKILNSVLTNVPLQFYIDTAYNEVLALEPTSSLKDAFMTSTTLENFLKKQRSSVGDYNEAVMTLQKTRGLFDLLTNLTYWLETVFQLAIIFFATRLSWISLRRDHQTP